MKKSRRRNKKMLSDRTVFEILEMRLLYAVHNTSFDVTDLTELRGSPTYSSITGKGIAIAVLDTGVDAKNPDLTSKVTAFYNAVEDPIPKSIGSSSVSSAVDNDGHGTHVSGIAASADPTIGVAYGASLVDVKVIADQTETQLAGDPLLRGLEFVADYASQLNIKVVNMSLGEATSSGGINDNTVPASDDLSREIQTLESLGITVVAASGNSYANDPVAGEGYPAVVSTISVANVWSDTGSGYDFASYSYGTSSDSWAAVENSAVPDQLAGTSQRSTLSNQVAAPGENIYSDWNGTSTDNSGSDLLHNTISGTSMASPFVAGLVALMQQAAYTYGGRYITNPEEVLSIIKSTSDVIQDPTSNYGDTRLPISGGSETGGSAQPLPGTGDTFDRINVFKAVQAVQALFTGTISNADIDNTQATATIVPNLNGTADYTESGTIGTDGLNQVGVNDVDVYKVILDETGTFTSALSQPSGGTAFIASLRLFNSAGGQISVSTGTSSAGYPTLTTTGAPLVPGTYYIGVSSAGNIAYDVVSGSGKTGGVTTGDYSLALSLQNPDPNGVPAGAQQVDLTNPDYESNRNVVSNLFNGILGSDPPATGSSARVTVANGDVDMFEIVAPDTGNITANVDVSAYGIDGADSYVEVFDSNLNLIAQNGQNTGGPNNSQIQFNVTIGDTYYVAVTVAANAGFDATDPYTRRTASTSTPSDYDLYLTFNNGNTDGTALLANSTTPGTTVTGNIASTNPLLGAQGGFKYVDWYDYTASTAGLLDLTATATSAGFSPSVEFWTLTFDSTGAVSGISEIGQITGSGKSLIEQVTAGETLYASVTGAGNSSFNWFSLGSGSGGDTGSYSMTSSLLSSSALNTLNDSSIDYGTPQTILVNQFVTGDIGTYNGLIIGATDVDLYKFTATSSGAYSVATNTSPEGSVDTYLRLFDSSGNQLASNDNADQSTTSSLIRANLVAGQTYYIGVSGSGNESYDPISGANATAANTTGTYGLEVTEANIPAVTINQPAAVSPATGQTSIVFTVSLDFASTSTVSVDYNTVDNTALAGVDYNSTTGTLTFLPGQTSLTVTVPLLLNANASGTTTFYLDLSSPSGDAVIDGGQGTGTISSLPVNQIDFKRGTPGRYLDSLGRPVEFILNGPGSGVISVIGTSATAVEVTVTGTTAQSQLSVISSARETTALQLLQINGSLASLNAPHVELEGDLTVTGTIATLTLAGASGSNTLSIEGTGTGTTLQLGNISDLSVMSSEPLNALVTTNWANLTNSDLITAPLIKVLKSSGAFGASLAVGSSGPALESVRIAGAITAGDWAINGSAGSIVAGSSALEWSADFTGSVNSLVVNGAAAGAFTAASVNSLRVGGNVSSGLWTFTGNGTAKDPDVRTLSVAGTFSNSQIRSAGDITSIRLGAISDSTIDAGTSASLTGLAQTAADFVTQAEIATFAVTGLRGQTFAVSNSEISAAELGHVIVTRIDTSNNGTPFGFATDSLAAFVNTEPGKRPFAWNARISPAELSFAGDFVVKLV